MEIYRSALFYCLFSRIVVKFTQIFEKTRSDSTQLCCVSFIASIKNFSWFTDTLRWSVKRISFEYRNIWVFRYIFKKLNFLFIILFTFIDNSSSKNGRKTIASKLLTHRFSAGCVGEFFRPQAVVLLSSEPRAEREKVKLCKLMAKKEKRLGACPRFSCSLSTVSQKKNKRLLVARFPRTNFDTKILNFVLKLVLPKGNSANFSHFYFTFIAKIVLRDFFS